MDSIFKQTLNDFCEIYEQLEHTAGTGQKVLVMF